MSYIEKSVMGVNSGIVWAPSIVVGVAAYQASKWRSFHPFTLMTTLKAEWQEVTFCHRADSSNGCVLLGFYTIANFTDMYTIEESVVGGMKFLNKQVRVGRTSVILLTIAMSLGFVSTPMWFSDYGKQYIVLLAACVVVATMLTPMVYARSGDGTRSLFPTCSCYIAK